jgi:S1-C subfamily serine protease/TPR repeat protein
MILGMTLKNVLRLLVIILTVLTCVGAGSGYAKEVKGSAIEAFKAKDYERAFQLFAGPAESGNAGAQIGLCILHWHGLGTVESTNDAIAWCKKASEKKSSAENYGELLAKISSKVGPGSNNKTQALTKLEEQANAGDSEAQWLMRLAHEFSLFDIIERDAKARKLWFKKALANNYPEALLEEARKYVFETHKPETLKTYISLLEKAANQGNAQAMSLLGFTYRPVGYFDRSKEKPHKDYVKATNWYRKAVDIEPGYSWELAELLRDHLNPERDLDEGRRLLIFLKDIKRASEAHVELAKIFIAGEEVPKDERLAAALLKQALVQPYADFDAVVVPANYLLGQLDPERAADYYSAIFQHKFAEFIRPGSFMSSKDISAAAYRLSRMLSEKRGDGEEVQRYLKIASDLGDSRASRLLNLGQAKNAAPTKELASQIQSHLNLLGFKAGAIDGVFGRKSFDALRAFECIHRLPVSGVPTDSILQLLKAKKRSRPSQEVLKERFFEGIINLEIDCVRGALQLGVGPNSKKYRRGPIALVSKSADRSPSKDEALSLRYQITKLLIDNGSRISLKNSNIFSAVSDGDEKLIRLVLENGENALRRLDGQSLMHWAAHYGQPGSMTVLSEFGAPELSERKQAQQRVTNLPHSAFAGSGILLVEDALKRGAWINGSDARGRTPLGAAVGRGVYEKNHADLIAYLLKKGADPNAMYGVRFRDGEGDPVVEKSLPLNYFVMSNPYTMNERKGRKVSNSRKHAKEYAVRAMNALINMGAKVAGKDSIGRTPLHWAAKVGNYEAAKILLAAGAVRIHRDKLGKLPLDYAESAEMIALLKGTARPSVGKKGGKDTKPSTGSGVFVTKVGHVITNSHVVDGCEAVSLNWEKSSDIPAKIVGLDRKNDVALLLSEKPNERLSPLRADNVRLGEAVIVAGYPYGKFVSSGLKVTSGIVSGVKGLGDNSAQFQLDAAIQPGNSGGPVFDRQGNIVGIVVAQLNKLKMASATGSIPENTNFAIKAGTVRVFMEANGVIVEADDRSGYQSTEAIAQIAAKQTVMVQCHKNL